MTRSPELTYKIMSAVKSKDTKSEVLLGKAMWKKGLRYRKHYKLPGKPDFVFVKAKTAIFCDGDFWHGYKFDEWKERLSDYWLNKIQRNIERDKINDAKLLDENWTILHFWEWEILEDVEECKKKVFNTLVSKGYKK